MSIYVVSRNGLGSFALLEGNALKVFFGVDAETEAHSWALREAKESELNVFVFRVNLHSEGSYKVVKEVRYVAPKQAAADQSDS